MYLSSKIVSILGFINRMNMLIEIHRKAKYLVKVKGHIPNLNSNITRKSCCAEPRCSQAEEQSDFRLTKHYSSDKNCKISLMRFSKVTKNNHAHTTKWLVSISNDTYIYPKNNPRG
jgi:hypothetical protein